MKNAKVLSALGLMTLASTAALAASAAPTLGSVLDASGIKVSGNVAGSYIQAASVPADQPSQATGTFNIDQALLSIAYQPKSGFGAVVDIASGTSVTGLQVGTNNYPVYGGQGGKVSGNNETSTALTQAYIQYANGGLTVIGGRFYTAAGYEVFPVTGYGFVTHSQTYALESTYHTGVRASYAVNDMLSLSLGVNDGVFAMKDQYQSTLGDKTVEFGAVVTPIKDLSVAFTGYVGHTGAKNNTDKESLFSLVTSYNITKALSVALNVDQGKYCDTTDNCKYTAYALYGSYAFNDQLKLGLRAEQVKPKGNNVAFLSGSVFATTQQQKTDAVAVVLGYSPAKNFELRTELSDVDVQGATPRIMIGAVQGVLKF